MTREEAKEIFINRGFINGIYNGDKWRDACIVISEWLKEEPITKNDCAEQNGCITCSLDDGDDCCRKLFEESMQEPKSEWEYDHAILKAYSDGANEVLDKIDEIITDALDKSTDQKESQTLRWVLDKISEVT